MRSAEPLRTALNLVAAFREPPTASASVPSSGRCNSEAQQATRWSGSRRTCARELAVGRVRQLAAQRRAEGRSEFEGDPKRFGDTGQAVQRGPVELSRLVSPDLALREAQSLLSIRCDNPAAMRPLISIAGSSSRVPSDSVTAPERSAPNAPTCARSSSS